MAGILSMIAGGTYSTKPDAPTIGSATATGTTTATVAFTAPARNGGVAISSYTATSSPGGITGTLSQAGSGTITVSGLTTGTAYTFTVTATNSVGTSVASSASNSITTYLAPANTVAPVVSGTATVGQTLSTTNGTWNGVPTPTFTYQWQRAGTNIGSATSSTYVLVAADAGNAIRCVVTATNAVSAVSANSNATSAVAASVPGAPTIGTATATGATTATISFTAPASNGGSTITSYTATSSPSSFTGTLSQAGSGTITVTGLSGSTAYTFTVTATNSVGTSAASSASNSITTSAPNWFTQQVAVGTVVGNPGAPMLLSNGSLMHIGNGYNVGDGVATNTFTAYDTSASQVYARALYANTCLGSISMAAPSYISSSDKINYALQEGGPTAGSLGVGSLSSVSSASIAASFTSRTSISKQVGSTSTHVGMGAYSSAATDSSGNIYVGLNSYKQQSYGCCEQANIPSVGLAKLNSSGTPQWAFYRPFTTLNEAGFTQAIAFGGSNVYVGAGHYEPTNSVSGFLCYKFNTSGTCSAAKRFHINPHGNNGVMKLCVDSSENVYAITTQFSATGNGGLQITKLNSSLAVQWSIPVSCSDSNGFLPTDIIIGTDGNIYFCAQMSSAAKGYRQVATVFKMNTSGVLQWARRIGGTSSNTSTISFTAPGNYLTTNSTSLYVVGSYSPTTGASPSTVTMKLPLDGSGTATGITFSGLSSNYNLDYDSLTVTTGSSSTLDVYDLPTSMQTAVLGSPTITNTQFLRTASLTTVKTNI